jgi:hypothetical protein
MEVDHEGQGAMSDVLKLPTQDAPGLHRQIGMLAFQCLNTRHFIGAHHRFTALNACLGGLIQFVDDRDLLVRLRIGFGIQIVAYQVRL